MTDHHTITDRDTQPGTLTDARASLPGRVDTERSCPVCGTCFTPSPRKPAHTYCCERCRATAWRHRRRDAARRVAELTAERATSSSTTSTTTTDVNHVTNHVTNDVGENEVNAVQHCPALSPTHRPDHPDRRPGRRARHHPDTAPDPDPPRAVRVRRREHP